MSALRLLKNIDKDLLIITSGRVLQILLGLVSVRVFTSLLPAAEVGNIYLVNAILGFFGLSLVSPVGLFLNRRLHVWADEKSVLNHWFLYNIFLVILAGMSVIIVFGGHQWLDIGGGMPTQPLVLLVAGLVFFSTWNQTVLPALNMLHRNKSFVGFTVATLGASLVISVALVRHGSATAITWLLGQLVAQGVFSLAALIYFAKVEHNRFDLHKALGRTSFASLRSLGSFALPLIVTNCCLWAQSQSYRMIVEKRIGLEFLGMLALGISIASNVATAVESIVQQHFLPGFYRGVASGDSGGRTASFNSLIQQTLPLYLSLTIFVSCTSPFLVDILAHRKFAGAALFVACGAWMELGRMSTNLLSLSAQAEMQTGYTVKAYFVGAVMTVAGIFVASGTQAYAIFIPVSLLIGGGTATLMMYVSMKKLMPIKVGIRTILRALLQSIPFALAIPLSWLPRNFALSVGVIGVCGLYFLALHYRLARPNAAHGQ